MSLNTAAVTELAMESAVYALLTEWLQRYFDGNAHVVGNNAPVRFPKCDIASGDGAPRQPLSGPAIPPTQNEGAEIRIVMLPRMETQEYYVTALGAGKLASSYVLFNFWISAKKAGPGQSQLLAERIAERLKALLTNPDTRYDLAQKGIAHLQPHAPQWLPSADYAKRLVACGACVHYTILFGDVIVNPGGTTPSAQRGLEDPVSFNQSDPLIAGEFLPGVYQWSARRVLRGARLTCQPPLTGSVVLGLSLNGVLTGDQLVIVPVAGESVLALDLAVSVEPGVAVRWQVVGAPEPEKSAWQAALVLDTILG